MKVIGLLMPLLMAVFPTSQAIALTEERVLVLNGTQFTIVGHQDGIGAHRIEKALRLAWPMFYEKFGLILPNSTVIDADAPIGGGPIKDFTVGIFKTSSIAIETAKFIEATVGWKPETTTAHYIERYYSEFEDPYQAYADDIVTHELGHFLFGWGITKVKSLEYNDAWFALALGVLNDRLIWKSLERKPSPLFQGIVNRWKTHFSKIAELDQRLVSPNLSRDAEFELGRLQGYAHGKAWVYLDAVRKRIGEIRFDQITYGYLRRPIGSKITYDDFLSNFSPSEISKISELEKVWVVR